MEFDVMEYRYLFPFETVPFHSHILIYGAGILGQEYLKQLLITKYCIVVAMVDQNYADYPSMVVPVVAPEKVHELKFDYVVIALRSAFALPAIKQTLYEQGIEDKKIISIMERNEAAPLLLTKGKFLGDMPVLHLEENVVSLAIYMSGGIGDMIIQKRFLMEILKFFPLVHIDIYAAEHVSFLHWLYSDILQVRNITNDMGMVFSTMHRKYMSGISIYGSHFLTIDYLDEDKLSVLCPDLLRRLCMIRMKSEKEHLSLALPHAISFRRRDYQGENCYTWYNFGEIFSIREPWVTIPISQTDCNFLVTQVKERKYFTVNTGNGSRKNGMPIAKSWPTERFQEVIEKLGKIHSDWKPVQVGEDGEPILKGIAASVMGQGFGVVAHVLGNAMFHLDIEGGLVHLASQLRTRCVVLFGPSDLSFFSYPGNINIQCGTCHGCSGLYADINICARHMVEPECMYSITPDIVVEKIEEGMSFGLFERRCD